MAISNRVQSSRRLEREAGRNVEVMWLTGRLAPDHKTIADFRKDNGRAIRQVCARFVALCRTMGLLSLLVVQLLLAFFLLFMNFDSLKTSTLIMLNIPLALVGGVAALWLAGLNLSVPASVGFIALFGIALGNGMVLVTYIDSLVEDGLTIERASIEGACVRVRPVLMTATCAALGLIPLLYATGTGSEVQRPLATVVIGGLVTSTILTLLVLPSLYRWFVPEHLRLQEVKLEESTAAPAE